MHEVIVTAMPQQSLVALEIDDAAVVLQPAAAMHTGLLLAKASIQAAAKDAVNVEGFALMLDAIDGMLAKLVTV